MRVRRVATAAAMAALVMSSGCGDDQRSVSVLVYPELRDEAYCQYLVRCGAMPSLEVCRQFRWYYPFHSAYVASVLEGRISWDVDAAEACLDRIAARSCDNTSLAARQLGCDITAGTLPDGASCVWSIECVSEECWAPDCEAACCVGVCVGSVAPVPALLGEPCRLAPCAEGHCARSGLCEPFLGEGEACEIDGTCGDGLVCGLSRPWLCERLPGPGEPCNRECREIGNVCGTLSRRCEPIAEGSLCADGYACGLGQVCDASSHCRLTVRRAGESCGDLVGRCETGTYCDGEYSYRQGVCQPVAAVGEACTEDRGCASGWCDAGACRDGGCGA